MANERLDILINAKNNASGALTQVKGQIQGLDSAAKAASSGLAGIAGFVGAGAIVALATQAAGAVVEFARMADASAKVEHALDGLAAAAGTSSEAVIKSLKAASGGAIADYDLMLAANKAFMLGVVDSTDQLEGLMKIAATRGAAMGLSMTQAFDNLVTGLGRGSALILDNLGITIDANKVNAEYAASIGKTVAQLSEQEKKQALVNSVMREAKGITVDVDNLGSAMERAAAASANLKVSIGEAFSPAVAAYAEFIADQMQRIADNNQKMAADQTVGTAAAFGLTDAAALEVYSSKLQELHALQAAGIPLTGAQNQQLIAYTATMNAHWDTLSKTADSTRALKDDAYFLAQAEVEVTGSVSEATQAIVDQANKLNLVGNAVEGYTAKLTGMAAQLSAVVGVGGAIAQLKGQEDQIKRNVAAYEAMGWSQQQIALVVESTGLQVVDQWQEMINAPGEAAAAAEKAARSATGAYSTMVDDLQAKFDSLKGKVSGVLQGALDPGVGVNPDDILPRGNAVNENARRVADIAVNGFKDQSWLEEFRNSAPDIAAALEAAADPKTAAAQLLKDFQDGLVPELIDKDAAKDRVRRMLLGEANMASMADEIATELSQEMGLSLAKAQEATGKALGTGTQGAAAVGLDGAATGGEFVDSMTTAITERNNDMQKSGEAAGAWWKTGFLSITTVDIPTALVLALATLVTPEVQKAIDAQKSQRGAY